jgi:Glycosyltransferase family 87
MTDSPSRTRIIAAFLDERLDRNTIRFFCITILLLSLALVVASFATAEGGRTVWGPSLGADFTGFYTAGYILNRHSAAQLFDNDSEHEDSQYTIHHKLHPHLHPDETLPFVHPPFVALAFRPLAMLPYKWAFAIWMLISLALYLAGLAVILRKLPASACSDRVTVFLLALSFEPLVMECWLGGQLSSVGFCCLAVALAFELTGRPFVSGLVLGLCLYKPTLLVVIVPVLLVARRFWTLLGFTLTALILTGLTLWGIGWDGCHLYLDVLLGFTQTATEAGFLKLPTEKYVDLNAFTRLLLGGPSEGQRLLLLVLAMPLFLGVLGFAWRLDARGDNYRRLTWSAALFATLVVNLYVGVYDSVLAVLGGLLTAAVLWQRAPMLPGGFRAWLVGLCLVPWFTQPLARAIGVQPFTLVLYGAAIYPLWLAYKEPAATPAGSIGALNGSHGS